MKLLISKVLNKIILILIKLKLIKPKSIFYMGGVNILPPPLDAEEEMELLKKLETDDTIKQILIERNLRLVVYISRKFENTGIDIEDLISIGTIGLIKAVSSYKSDKNVKLGTYASKCIDNEILMYLRAGKKYSSDLYLQEPIGNDSEGNEIAMVDVISSKQDDIDEMIYKKQQIELLFEKLENELDEREKDILIMRYGLFNTDELTQIEIAEKMGISRSYVSRIEKKAVEKLRKYF